MPKIWTECGEVFKADKKSIIVSTQLLTVLTIVL